MSLVPVFIIIFFTINLEKQYLVVALALLIVPVLDKRRAMVKGGIDQKRIARWLFLLGASAAVIMSKPESFEFALFTLFFAAVPEEWFFRAYLMPALGAGIKANIVTSIAFSMLHLVTQGSTTAMLVFLPSLFYGWLYQKTNDLVAVILLHALSNIVYVAFLHDYVQWLYV